MARPRMNLTIQFLRYVSVAGVSAASDWLVFTVLFAAFGSPIAAQATSRIVGGLVSFTINKYWSFRSGSSKQTWREARRFLMLFAASYVISISMLSVLTMALVYPYLAKLMTDTACFLFNFLVMRVWVYPPRGTTKLARPTLDAPLPPAR
jgi:putative flippase GtrA